MSDLTPERIRDAAEVVRAYQSPPHVWTQQEAEAMWRVAKVLDDIATRVEARQAADAKREKSGKWIEFARVLLDRYPALADDGRCEQ